jgi:uncharacterized protein (TIGR02145 family)
MKKSRFLLFSFLLSILLCGCSKSDINSDQTSLTIGNKNLGYFNPKSMKAYKPLEGYVVRLVSDTISFTMLLPQIKTESYSITNKNLSEAKALFNIGLKSTAYSAIEGTISITDTSNNTISGSYTVTNSTMGYGDPLKISNGKFNKVQIESYVYGSVEDYEHNHYKTIQIGTQTWMAQNLSSWIYSNGDSIREVYRYNKSDSLMNIYGLYYTWAAATHGTNTEMTQGACPAGWHLPSNIEWQQLLTELSGEAIAGGRLKSMLSWDIPNGWADDSSGFAALGAGIHNPVIEYTDYSERMGMQSYFWSSTFNETVRDLSTAWSVALNNSDPYAIFSPYYRTDMGFSVRCIKN